MSYQVGSACYPTAEAAASASASSVVGSVVTHGGAAYVVGIGDVTSDSITYALQPVGAGTPMMLTASYAPQPCGLLTGADGLTLGWMVGGVWLAVYAVSYLRRALFDGGGDDGRDA